jgi:ABC-type transport system involved in multi-copper enzyme maturation permease subunit
MWSAACLALFGLLGPLPATQGFLSERRADMMNLLGTTPLRPTQLIWGKIASSVLLLWILLLSTFPLATFCLILGGVEPIDLVFLYFAFLLSALILGMLGVACSLMIDSPQRAFGMTYSIALPIVLILWLIRNEPYFAAGLAVLQAVGLMIAGAIFTRLHQKLRWPADSSGLTFLPPEISRAQEDIELPGEWLADWALQCEADPLVDVPGDERDPFLWLEMTNARGRLQAPVILRRTVLIGWMVITGILLFFILTRPAGSGVFQGEAAGLPWRWVAVAAFAMGIILGAPSLVQERELDTLDLLRLTGASPFRILKSKILLSMILLGKTLTLVLFPIILGASWLGYQVGASPFTTLVEIAWGLATVSILGLLGIALGMIESAYARDSGQAVLRAAIVGAVLILGPWGIARLVELSGGTPEVLANIQQWSLIARIGQGPHLAGGLIFFLILILAAALLLGSARGIEPARGKWPVLEEE